MRFSPILPCLILVVVIALASCKQDPPISWSNTPFDLEIPAGWSMPEIPEDNPMSVEGIALGRMLFYDPILSADSTQSCSSCHLQTNSFADPRRFSIGIDNIPGTMNAPHIVNPAWMTRLFWNGRSEGLEAQAVQPVINPIEMHDTWTNVESKLRNHSQYPNLFYAAFGTNVATQDLAVKAIAQFERTFVSSTSRFDLFLKHDPAASYTQSEYNGYQIFFTETGDCFHCHGNPLMTDNLFHNNGLDSVHVGQDVGFYEVTGLNPDVGKFKTPSLRNIALTAPFMHDGRFSTLEEVVNFYSEGIRSSATIDPLIIKPPHPNGLHLTPTQKADLVAFLHTLTDTAFINRTDLKSPF